MIRPITYNFDEDLSIKHRIDYETSIVGTGLDKIYDITKYKTIVKEKGIDFYVFGKAASINKGSAMRVFKNANPNTGKTMTEFLKYMLKS